MRISSKFFHSKHDPFILIHNVPKWSKIQFCTISNGILKVRLTILGDYALKGWIQHLLLSNTCLFLGKKYNLENQQKVHGLTPKIPILTSIKNTKETRYVDRNFNMKNRKFCNIFITDRVRLKTYQILETRESGTCKISICLRRRYNLESFNQFFFPRDATSKCISAYSSKSVYL